MEATRREVPSTRMKANSSRAIHRQRMPPVEGVRGGIFDVR